VPSLITDGGNTLTQSLAIIEWLEETYPEPALLPADRDERARVRAFALAIGCDVHPVQNLKVLQHLRGLNLSEEQVSEWAAWINRGGLAACEALLADSPGPFCFGASPTFADICLVPQLANAQRFNVDVSTYPRLLQADRSANEIAAYKLAAPQFQPDAE
jgi:maleylpyruvate isomerase